jgi:hypothetical protein
MFQMIRRKLHLTPSMAIAFVALVFAVTGASFATGAHGGGAGATLAKSKAKPKAKTGPRGPAGPAGKTGASGPAGPAGPQGATGAKGETGAAGTNGTNGEPGAKGATGAAGAKGETGATGATGPKGEPWPAGGTLPSKATETGAWGAAGMPALIGFLNKEVLFAAISFTIPLTEAPEAHVIGIGETGTGGGTCPTSSDAANPEAEPGNLCIFVSEASNVKTTVSTPPGEAGLEKAGKTGSVLLVVAETAKEGVTVKGTWAVTAK